MQGSLYPKEATLTQMHKFNPGLLQNDDDVAAQFVVRHNEFRALREVIGGNIGDPSNQHVLVIGSRGQGKTMLLTRFASELRTDAKLSKHFLPVQFMEEHHEIDSIADFWLETLFQLAQEIAAEDVALAHELTEKHGLLMNRWREQGYEELARWAVLEAVDRIQLRLVLLIENVQSLFAEAGEDFGWGLRAILQSVPQITLVATATSRFDALDDPQAPFFEFFRYIHLEPLNTQECRRLWSFVSKTESSNHDIRPLEILTGGNPRLIVVVASFARHQPLRQLMAELLVLIDEHTEYFRNFLESIPKQERRVFIALIDLWRPSSSSEIAVRARLDIRVVSTMVKRLVSRGAVTIIEGESSRKRQYVASERLYSLYYKLRREHNERPVVESLIYFMMRFYDEKGAFTIGEQIFNDVREDLPTHVGFERALPERTALEEVISYLNWDELARASAKINEEDQFNTNKTIVNKVLKERENKNWQAILDLSDQFMYEESQEAKSKPGYKRNVELITAVRSDAFLALKQFDKVIDLAKGIERELDATHKKNTVYHSGCLKFKQALAHFGRGDFIKVQTECERIFRHLAESEEPSAMGYSLSACMLRAESEIRLGDGLAAISSLDSALTTYGERNLNLIQNLIARTMFRKGELLGSVSRDFSQSNHAFEELTKRFDANEDEQIQSMLVSASLRQAVNYGMLGDFEQELNHFDAVVDSYLKRGGTRHMVNYLLALHQKGRRLAELGRYNEALAICNEAERWLDINPNVYKAIRKSALDWHINCTRALGQVGLGNSEKALDALRKAYDNFDVERKYALEEILRLIVELVAAGASERNLIAVLESNETNAQALLPMVVALYRRNRSSMKAPTEVIEVAEDLLECFNYRLENGPQPGYFLRLATA